MLSAITTMDTTFSDVFCGPSQMESRLADDAGRRLTTQIGLLEVVPWDS